MYKPRSWVIIAMRKNNRKGKSHRLGSQWHRNSQGQDELINVTLCPLNYPYIYLSASAQHQLKGAWRQQSLSASQVHLLLVHMMLYHEDAREKAWERRVLSSGIGLMGAEIKGVNDLRWEHPTRKSFPSFPLNPPLRAAGVPPQRELSWDTLKYENIHVFHIFAIDRHPQMKKELLHLWNKTAESPNCIWIKCQPVGKYILKKIVILIKRKTKKKKKALFMLLQFRNCWHPCLQKEGSRERSAQQLRTCVLEAVRRSRWWNDYCQ